VDQSDIVRCQRECNRVQLRLVQALSCGE
jgi:hypothetical protein